MLFLKRGLPNNPLATTIVSCALAYWFFNSYLWQMLTVGDSYGSVQDVYQHPDFTPTPSSYQPKLPVIHHPQAPSASSSTSSNSGSPGVAPTGQAPAASSSTSPSSSSTLSGSSRGNSSSGHVSPPTHHLTVHVDYAVATSGGRVLKHSPLYSPNGELTVAQKIWKFLFPSQRAKRIYAPPNLLLYPDNSPGRCSPFEGTNGFVIIQTPKQINLTGARVEHIDPVLVESTDSAPRHITILSRNDTQLASFEFDISKGHSQLFPTTTSSPDNLFKIFWSTNHGNMRFTCIYRIQLHGDPAEEEVLVQ